MNKKNEPTEKEIAASLDRYEKLCELLYDLPIKPTDAQLLSALTDSDSMVRAEVLDYVILNENVSDELKQVILDLRENDSSEHTSVRLMILCAKWKEEYRFSPGPDYFSRFDFDYFATWASVARAIEERSAAAIISAVSYSLHSNQTIAEVARKLILEHLFDDTTLVAIQNRMLGTFADKSLNFSSKLQ